MSYHHFKGNNLNRSDEVQRLVTQRIVDSKVEDEQRENSKVWELKHCASCVQIGRILALKRGLSVEIAEIICVLHDIYAIDTGKYENHAHEGALIAREILGKINKFTEEEIDLICDAIHNHSDKQVYSDNPYIELIKDSDVFDCMLYEGTMEYYRENKSPEVLKHYLGRFERVGEEMGVGKNPPKSSFHLKEDFKHSPFK